MSTVIRSLMVKVGADLTEMQKGLKKAAKELKSAGQEISSLGASLTTGVTLPIAGAAAASIKFASDLEESTNKVNVAFRGSADQVKKWSDTTLETFGIAKGTALDMAALFGDMGTAMGQTPAEAAKMSESLVGLAGDLASFKNIGIEEAQTALKGIFTGEGESLKSLGVVMQDSTLEAYAMATGQKKAYDEMTQAEKVALRYAYVMDATKNAQGDFARTSGGTANQLRIVQESLKEAAATLGQNLLPIITPILQKINGLIQKFSSMDEGAQKFILTMAGIAAAIGPVLSVIGGLTTGLGGAVGAVSKAAGVLSKGGGLASAFGALIGPGGIALLVITAIAAAAYLIISNWSEIKDFFTKLWESVSGAFISAWDGIKNFFSGIWSWLQSFFSQWGVFILAVLAPFIGIPLLIYTYWDEIKLFYAGLWEKVKSSFSEALTAIIQFFNDLPANIGFALGLVIGNILKFGIDLATWVIETIPVVIESIAQFFAELPARISATVTGVFNAISLWGMNLASWVTLNIPMVVNSIITFFASLPGQITSAITGTITAIGTWAGSLITKASDEIPKVVASIVGYFKALPEEMLKVGKDLVTGLWNGMNGMMSWIKKKIKEFASSIISGIKSALGISSPSKVMADKVGKWIPAGIAKGITGNSGLVQAAMDTMSGQLTSRASLELEGSLSNGRVSAAGYSDSNPGRTTNLTFNVQSYSQARYEIDLLNKQLAVMAGI
ncbi:hypothetical protein [Gudongella oleilytica]|uniref:hypothetical protein n=1 Tax=Gudongella oleilytica TaxID=1582259 RepID=UPI000FF89B51|nr:hypothetical protein [Gudongella oleilytica]